MKIDIQTAASMIDRLIDCRIVRYRRICDMVCLYFTDEESKVASDDENSEPYGLHIMCWVRVIDGNKIIAASEEMYCSADADSDDFQWDHEKSIFDEKMNQFLESSRANTVCAASVNAIGDLIIYMNNECRIEIMAHRTNTEDEMWRFMAGEHEPHLIASIDGYYFSDE